MTSYETGAQKDPNSPILKANLKSDYCAVCMWPIREGRLQPSDNNSLLCNKMCLQPENSTWLLYLNIEYLYISIKVDLNDS